MPPFAVRAATPEDVDLTYAITRDAMQLYVEQTWGAWNEPEQWQKHQENYTPATHRIVLVEGSEAGLVATEYERTHLWLVKLYLRSGYRDRGLGTDLLRMVLAEAAAYGKPARVRVLRVNTRAQALYLRHGFRIVGETPERLFMERESSGA